MTNEEIERGREEFNQFGVPTDRIFNEIMRARYLDYHLFANPSNREYGISVEDLYNSMKKTESLFGVFQGDERAYVNAYTLAMGVDPMAYAPGVSPLSSDKEALLEMIVEEALKSGKTVLFAGADHYLAGMSFIFETLRDRRIAVAFDSPEWKQKIQYAYPRGRAMVMSELKEDKESYDFIFDFESQSFARAASLLERLSDAGTLQVCVPYPILLDPSEKVEKAREKVAHSRALVSYFDGLLKGKETEFLTLRRVPVDRVAFGEAALHEEHWKMYPLFSMSAADFEKTKDWNYDVYSWSGCDELRTLFEHGIFDHSQTIGDAFAIRKAAPMKEGIYPVLTDKTAARDSGLRKDLLLRGKVSDGDFCQTAEPGDLIIRSFGDEVTASLIPDDIGTLIVQAPFLVLRPTGKYTSAYLKLFLDSPLGQILFSTLLAGSEIRLISERILRFPLPMADEEAIARAGEMCRQSMEELARAEQKYRDAQKTALKSILPVLENKTKA